MFVHLQTLANDQIDVKTILSTTLTCRHTVSAILIWLILCNIRITRSKMAASTGNGVRWTEPKIGIT